MTPLDSNDNRRWICREVAADAERDVYHFEGKPFDGRTVAEYLGGLAACIVALANVLETVLPPEPMTEESS